MAGRASIVGAAETSVGKVRDHNEDAHFIDPEAGIFIVCDGMGGHAAGEVASNLAVQTIRKQWAGDALHKICEQWLELGTPDARKQLLSSVNQGVVAAHEAIVSEAQADRGKQGMGTTVVGAIIVGGDVVFAHCGDSRAYLVRDGITVQLTEDHTLLARLLAAGVDVDTDGDGARFKSMLTNALGIGQECKVSTFVVPVADGDRFLLCSDGITEYVQENEIGEVLTTMPSPARSAQRLVEIALARGGGDNATALVVRVLEAGETARPSEQIRKDEQAVNSCTLWAKVNPQQRLRALRIALPREHNKDERIAAQTLGDKVAWIVIEGEVEQDGYLLGPGALLYPEALLGDRPLPDKHGLAVARSEVRALAMRADDFKELCDDDPELAEHLLEALAAEIGRRLPMRRTGNLGAQDEIASRKTEQDLGRADTGQFPALDPTAAAANPGEAGGAPTESASRASSPRLSRGSTPPAGTRSSLIVAPSETAAAVDEALTGLTAEPKPVSDADKAALGRATTKDTLKPQVLAEPPPAPGAAAAAAAAKAGHLSEPEIQIEHLAEAAGDERADAPAEDVIELVAADLEDDEPPRTKRPSKSPD